MIWEHTLLLVFVYAAFTELAAPFLTKARMATSSIIPQKVLMS